MEGGPGLHLQSAVKKKKKWRDKKTQTMDVREGKSEGRGGVGLTET